ncbi:MAG: cytochrome c biogenesis protein CcsA [Phycisphaerae bacterium]|nr:cytochrome c biogenesis protein CcsA [Phycisphaerae bacterium]
MTIALRSLVAAITLLTIVCAVNAAASPPPVPASQPASPPAAQPDGPAVTDAAVAFAAAVDLRTLGQIAVHDEGRLKSFDSFAASSMRFVSGPHRIDDQSSTFTYLDLMLRPDQYGSTELIYVKKKPMRAQIVTTLRGTTIPSLDPEFDAAMDRFMETGLIAEDLLRVDAVAALLGRLSTDLIRTARFVEMIETALAIKQPQVLLARWKIIPPETGDRETPWASLDQLVGGDAAVVSDEHRTPLVGAWRDLVDGWVRQDAVAVNASAQTLATVLPRVNPTLYPSPARAGWPWSFRGEGRGPWLVVGVLLLLGLVGLVIGRGTLRVLSASFVAALVGFSLIGLWLNGFGAGLTSAIVSHPVGPLEWESAYFRAYNLTWFWVFYALSLIPLLLNIVFRWRAARWIGLGMFLLAFALHTFSLVLRWYVAERWPNTNMFEAVTTAAWFGGCSAIVLEIFAGRTMMRNLFALGSAVASMVALMCVYYFPLQLDAGINNRMPVLHDVWLYIHTNVIIFSYCLIFMAAVSALLYLFDRLRRIVRGERGGGDYARVGGAGSLLAATPGGVVTMRSAGLGQVLDGTTMVLMELSFVMLWAGLVMGAIWADHSWGRPWGWDPKEVFALNTFLVFAVLIHVRLKTRDKGLWTALIALVGAAVMLFNWIAINFVITGLHSYA